MNPPTVTRRELTWVLLWAAFVMLLTCIPYLFALKLADGRSFGGFIWGVDEGNVYLTWMRQAADGDVFFRNQYSTAPENPRFFNLFLQAGGRLGGLLHVDMRVMFHVLRLLGGMFLLVSFYWLRRGTDARPHRPLGGPVAGVARLWLRLADRARLSAIRHPSGGCRPGVADPARGRHLLVPPPQWPLHDLNGADVPDVPVRPPRRARQ